MDNLTDKEKALLDSLVTKVQNYVALHYLKDCSVEDRHRALKNLTNYLLNGFSFVSLH
jgi:hypothetical protein